MNQYLTIVRDAKNVIVHAIHHSAADLNSAIQKGIYFTGVSSLNGYYENQRVAKRPRPFRYNVGEIINSNA